jgi:hypothetical protein
MVIPMTHDPWTDRLSEYVDDELAPADRLQLEQHLLDCAKCREIVDELREVAAEARTLEDTPPARDLWPAIASVLPRASSRGWSVTLSLPQALAASILLMTVSGLAAWTFAGRPASTNAAIISTSRAEPTVIAASDADVRYERAVADLTRLLEQRRSRLDPRTAKVIERNLATIDRAIGEALAALKIEPTDTYLAAHVADQRRRKLALLRQASQLVLAGHSN